MVLGLLGAVILILFFLFGGKEGSSFQRVDLVDFSLDREHFRIDEQLSKIYFKKGEQETWLQELPTIQGYPLYLKGKSVIHWQSSLTGDLGLYTFIYLDNLGRKGKIQVSLEIESGGKTRSIFKMRSAKKGLPILKKMKLAKGDRLIAKFKGHGIAYLSKPVMYRQKPVIERKNIILVATDTLRWDMVGAKIKGKSLTPHLDEFKKDCAVFQQTYAQSPWTLPSFMSLFTGLYEYNHHVDTHRPLELSVPNLVQPLSQKFITWGYHSGMAMRKRWGFSRGFDYYHKLFQTGALFPKAGQTLFRKALWHLDEAQFPQAFYFLHSYQVHDPYTPPGEYLEKLNPNPLYRKLDVVNQGAPWKTYMPVKKELKESMEELYKAEIHAYDAYFGNFIAGLKERGLYDNAMIVFMSDHGEEFYEHGGWAHSHNLYNEIIRVPLFIKFPGNGHKNVSVNTAVGIIDVLPTIMAYYGVETRDIDLDGKNLLPLLKGENISSREYLVSSIAESRYIDNIPPKFALLKGDYKVIYNHKFSPDNLAYFKDWGLPPEVPGVEVFNIKEDPGDNNDLSAQMADLVKKVMPKLIEINKILRKNILEQQKNKKVMDEEVKEQLKSLGYI